MNKLLLVLCAVIASFSVVSGHHGNKCMSSFGKKPFDHEKFAGDWYVIGKILSKHMPSMATTCNKAHFAYVGEGNATRVTIDVTMKVDDKEIKFMSNGQPKYPMMNSVTQAVWRKEEGEKWKGVFTQSILATDYDDFALSYSCQPIYVDETDMFDKIENIHIMSRKPAMESNLLRVLTNVLSGFDFDVSQMVLIDNTTC